MAKVNEDWRVLRHGSIDRIESNRWSIIDEPAEVLRRVVATV